jgi:hypothetical protein
MRKKRMRKDEKREVTPEFVNMSKEILYPQIQGVTNLSPLKESRPEIQGWAWRPSSQTALASLACTSFEGVVLELLHLEPKEVV